MRNKSAFLFLVVAIAFGAAASFAVYKQLGSREVTTAVAVRTVPVVVTRVDVPLGTSLGERHLQTVQWPQEYAPQGSFRKVEAVEARSLRRPLAGGEPVLEASLLPPGSEGGLAPTIDLSKRAVSVKVDPVIGVAGFVAPGTRVDVLTTLRRIDSNSRPYSQVILQDVPVLAIDQKMEEVKNGDPELVSVVTVQVDPEQAQKLVYASHEGNLQLALRNPGDHEEVKTSSISVQHVLSGIPVRRRTSAPRTTVQVIRGSAVSVKAL